jgi:hypothetical protein
LAGPSGGTTLNGSELKQEAQAMMDKLEEDLRNYTDLSNGGTPPWFIIG